MDLNINYQQVIERLRAQAREYESLGDFDRWAAYEEAAEKVGAWLQGSRQGNYPVDLAEFGIPSQETGPAAETAQAVEAPAIPTEEQAGIVGEVSGRPAIEPGGPARGEVGPPLEEAAIPAEVALPAEAPPSPGAGETALVEELPYVAPEEETPEEETPEQRQLRKEVRALRADLDGGQFGPALSQARALQAWPALTSELREQVQTLLKRAEQEQNRQVQALLVQGDQARAASDLAAARIAYKAVIDLDPDHEYARRAIFELERAGTAQFSEAQQLELRSGLQERRSIRSLGEAVYKAEAWQFEGRLPDELAERLTSARKYYDDWRIAQGQETTGMRYGNLKERKDAEEKIRKRVLEDEKEIFDITINRIRPSFEVLNEAQQLLEEFSKETAQYEIDRVKAALPAYPLWARQRLNLALEQPFHEYHARLLEKLRQEVDQWAEKKTQAEGLLQQAEGASDPLERLGYILRAQAAFPYLEGLASVGEQEAPRVSQARQTGAEWLASRMTRCKENARRCLKSGEYKQARDELEVGEKDLVRWPQPEKPAAIHALAVEYQTLRQQIDAQEANRKEFNHLEDLIRQMVKDPNQSAAALDLLAKLLKDERYDFPERHALESEMDQYKGIETLLRDLEEAHGEQNWERVDELAQKIIASQKAGQFAKRVDTLQTQARLELAIARARDYLEVDEIAKANSILSRLIVNEKDKDRQARLKRRLAPDLAKIKQCIDNNKNIQPLFGKAMELGQKQGAAERFAALRLLRYIGGSETPNPDSAWPPYQLSLRTADARFNASKVAAGLRLDLLGGLQQASQQRVRLLTSDELARLAEQARALREAGLLESEDERDAARWAEIAWGSQCAHAKEALGDWDGAVQAWSELNRLYPFWPEVEGGWLRAHIRQAVSQAERLRMNDQGEQALQELRLAQQDPVISRSWEIALALAETHALRGDFVQAFRALADAERLSELQGEAGGVPGVASSRAILEKKRAEIEREKEIQQVIARANNEWQSQIPNPREALRLLQKALARSPTQDSRRLKELCNKIFSHTEDNLLKTARQEKAKDSDDGKIQAVAALVDLRDLETIVQRPDAERRSTGELDALRAELAPAAKAITQKARQFEPINLRLEQAVREADMLSGQLQSFSSVIPLFKIELAGEIQAELERQRLKISQTTERLRNLQALLETALQPAAWEEALTAGDFAPLEQYQRQILLLELGGMLEVQNYAVRIQEWRELYERLLREIAVVKGKFEDEEDFAGIVVYIRRLRVRYDLRRDSQPWRQVSQKDYAALFHTLGDKLIIPNTHGEESTSFLVGWDEVEKAAQARAAELAVWENWRSEVERLGLQSDQARQRAKLHQPDTALIQQLADWRAVESSAETLLAQLDQGPHNGGQPAGQHSAKARGYEKDRQRRRNEVYSWLLQAQLEIAGLTPELQGPGKGFPTTREFDTAVKRKDWTSLEHLLQRARRVGASNEMEAGLIRLYENILNNRDTTGRRRVLR